MSVPRVQFYRCFQDISRFPYWNRLDQEIKLIIFQSSIFSICLPARMGKNNRSRGCNKDSDCCTKWLNTKKSKQDVAFNAASTTQQTIQTGVASSLNTTFVRLNDGQGFDAATLTFTAPKDGNYQFNSTFSFTVGVDGDVAVDLFFQFVKNLAGVGEQFSLIRDQFSVSAPDTYSVCIAAVIPLKAGDTVQNLIQSATSVNILIIPGASFSGFLIR